MLMLAFYLVSSTLAFHPVTRQDASRQLGQWRVQQTELDERAPLANDLQHFSDWFWDAGEDDVMFFSSENALVGGRIKGCMFEVEVIAEAPEVSDTFSTRALVDELVVQFSYVCVGKRMQTWQRRRYLSLQAT